MIDIDDDDVRSGVYNHSSLSYILSKWPGLMVVDRSDPDVLALVTQWQNGLHAWSNYFFLSYTIFGICLEKCHPLS